MSRSLATHVATALLANALIACVFLVDDHPLGSTCTFAGQTDGTCGRCLAAQCQPAINACCGDKNCQDDLGYLDSCGSDQGCAKLLGFIGFTLADQVSACVRARCVAECRLASIDGGVSGFNTGDSSSPLNGSTTLCSETSGAFSDITQCTCLAVSAGNGNGVACPRNTAPKDRYCCADLDFPSANSNCDCNYIGCTGDGSSTGCQCSPGGDGDLACIGPCCLLDDGNCRCREPSQCFEGETTVESCSADHFACPANKRRVTQCSSP